MVSGWESLASDPLAARAFKRATDSRTAAADCLLALLGNEEPSLRARTGALLVGEYLVLSIAYLRSKFKKS